MGGDGSCTTLRPTTSCSQARRRGQCEMEESIATLGGFEKTNTASSASGVIDG